MKIFAPVVCKPNRKPAKNKSCRWLLLVAVAVTGRKRERNMEILQRMEMNVAPENVHNTHHVTSATKRGGLHSPERVCMQYYCAYMHVPCMYTKIMLIAAEEVSLVMLPVAVVRHVGVCRDKSLWYPGFFGWGNKHPKRLALTVSGADIKLIGRVVWRLSFALQFRKEYVNSCTRSVNQKKVSNTLSTNALSHSSTDTWYTLIRKHCTQFISDIAQKYLIVSHINTHKSLS